MRIEVKLMATLRRHEPPGARGGSFHLDARPGTRVVELLSGLGVPDMESHVILVNGRDAQATQRLEDGDVVAIFPAMAGG
jgi:molybdopterin converting factor small subunit